MSKTSAGIALCEPNELYNILTQGTNNPACLDETYLLLFDTRELAAYKLDHIILARTAKNDHVDQDFYIPFGVHPPTTMYCIVYDSKTVSIVENTPAVKFANILASSGSKNPVMVLKGGYERFSAEYPFFRTNKIMHTPRELQHLPHYPSEILPLFLYLGDKRDACNAALNYNLKITSHVLLGKETEPAFPGKIETLKICVKDDPQEQLPLAEICEFIEKCWQKSERVLVYEESGCSRSAVAAIAYLMQKNNLKTKDACEYVKKCRNHVLPQLTFLDQLSLWETHDSQ